MAKRFRWSENIGMPLNPYGQQFVLGAQAGANAAHFAAMARQAGALNQLIDALESGSNPAERLYALAGVAERGGIAPMPHIDDLLAKIPDKTEQKRTAQKAVVDGLSKDSKRRATERTRDTGTWRSIGGIRGPLTRGGFTNNPLVAILTESAAQAGRETARNRRIERERRQRLSIGRRGALASRGFVPTGRTNRTGAAAATRPLIANTGNSSTRSAGDARVLTGSVANSGTKSGQQPSGVSGVPGTRADQATTVRTVSRDAGAVVSQQRTKTWAESQLSQLLSQSLTTASRTRSVPQLRIATRAGSRPSVRPSMRSSPSSSTGTTSSPLLNTMTAQAQGLGSSQASKECRCPKPKKDPKKSNNRSCTNPQISKSIKDGIITTKRKLQCPPSKLR